jgi:hypothetical protein
MRLHSTTIKRLLKIYETYGGHREEAKLLEELSRLDLSVYQRTQGPQEDVLVCTDELNEAIRGR